jgi:microcystin-dependent protein
VIASQGIQGVAGATDSANKALSNLTVSGNTALQALGISGEAERDLNSARTTGIYTTTATTVNRPPNCVEGLLEVNYVSDLHMNQVFSNYQGRQMWWRYGYSGGTTNIKWSPWRALYTEMTGAISYFAGRRPDGWLEANGSAVSRRDYPGLFEVITTRYGSGDGSTTFNLPDLRGQFLRGWDNARGVDSGRSEGSSQGDAIRNITGLFVDDGTLGFSSNSSAKYDGAFHKASITSAAVYRADYIGQTGMDTAVGFDASRTVPTASENRPINVALLVCIRAY